jgi:hypothetical protein
MITLGTFSPHYKYSGFIVAGNIKVIPARRLRKRALSMESLCGLDIKSHGKCKTGSFSFPLSTYCHIPPLAPTHEYVNKTRTLVRKALFYVSLTAHL